MLTTLWSVGDIMIGADGINSVVRRHVLGLQDIEAEYSGVLSIGCMVSRQEAHIPADFHLPAFIHTQAGTFLIFAVDQTGDKIQWATSLKVPERARKEWKSYEPQAVSDVKKEWADFQTEPVKSLVDCLSVDNIRLWAPYQMPEMSTWHSDRMCFLGDAAHAIPPSLGQGAALAFEDIAFLSTLLAYPPAIQKGYSKLFEHFEKTRKTRTGLIRDLSAKADASREKTESQLEWFAKSWGIWASVQVTGVMSNLSGNPVTGYDVSKESLVVV